MGSDSSWLSRHPAAPASRPRLGLGRGSPPRQPELPTKARCANHLPQVAETEPVCRKPARARPRSPSLSLTVIPHLSPGCPSAHHRVAPCAPHLPPPQLTHPPPLWLLHPRPWGHYSPQVELLVSGSLWGPPLPAQRNPPGHHEDPRAHTLAFPFVHAVIAGVHRLPCTAVLSTCGHGLRGCVSEAGNAVTPASTPPAPEK